MSSDSEEKKRSVVIEGTVLADSLVRSLEQRTMSPRDRSLVWIGVFVRLRVICDQQLGDLASAQILETVEAAYRLQRKRGFELTLSSYPWKAKVSNRGRQEQAGIASPNVPDSKKRTKSGGGASH
jgi:hypothetical protein